MKRIRNVFLLAVVVFCCVTGPAQGAEALAIATSVSGEAKVQGSGSGELLPVSVGQPFFHKDVIYTFAGGRVSLLFSDGSIYSIHPESRLSLDRAPGAGKNTMLSSLAGKLGGGLKDMFTEAGKQEALTAVPGFRKPATQKEGAEKVRILYPRNGMIMEKRPQFLWRGPAGGVTVSLTLKEPLGKVWSLTSDRQTVSYPSDHPGLIPGNTYFLKIESQTGAAGTEEVYFSLLQDREIQEIQDLANQLQADRDKHPRDTTATVLLIELFAGKRLFHQALAELDRIQHDASMRIYALQKKRKIYHEIGLWEEWEKAGKGLQAAGRP